MCIRRRKRKEKYGGKVKKRKRRQDTCCYKYGPRAWIRKCAKCICKRIARCIRRKVFGVPDPKLQDYEIAGHTMSSYKNMMKRDKSSKPDKSSKTAKTDTLFKFNESKLKSDNQLADIRSHPSFKNKNVATLFRNKKSLPIANISLKDLQLIDGYNASELIKKYDVPGSKAEVLGELVKEYKKGNLSMSGVSKSSKYKEKELDKEKLDKIIKQYEKVRKKSVANINQMRNMDKEELQKRFSLAGSKKKLFNQMIDDYRNGKVSLTKLTNSKTEPKKLNKDQMHDMLRAYKENKKSKNFFSSKLDMYKPYYEDAKENWKELKDKVSVKSLKHQYSKMFAKAY